MRSQGCKRNKQSKLMKVVCSPIRILSKVRDLYMKSIQDCSGRVGYGGGGVSPTPPEAPRLPKIFSVSSSTVNDGEELRELLRVASKRGRDSKMRQKMQQQKQSGMKQSNMGSSAGGIRGMRSYSVGVGKIGRIDEDKPCSFEEDELML